MAKRKNNKPRKSKSENKEDPEIRALYDKIRREFTAADLQKFTEVEEGIPVEKVIAEMEKIHRRVTRKRA